MGAPDERLRPFATGTQWEYLVAVAEHGSNRAAAEALGMNESTLRRSLKSLERKAARNGIAPEHDMTRPVPDGYFVKGVSTYYDKDGNAAGQWVKSSIDHERQAE